MGQWYYIYVYLDKWDNQTLPINEIIQFIKFHFPKKEGTFLQINANNGLIFMAEKESNLNINKFEKEFSENFMGGHIRMDIRNFDLAGTDTFVKIIEKEIPPHNKMARMQLKRLQRPGNCIMILDDDQMVTRQMEKLLCNIAYVVTLNKIDGFFDHYTEYAPDILFLDIHLREAKGNQILHQLTKDVDCFAHVVMISSDTEKEMVIDVKKGGAKGFIVKPFTRASVVQHLMRAPTFVPRSVNV